MNATSDIEMVESTYVNFRIENSIVFVVYKKDVTIDLEAAKEIAQVRKNFLKGRSYPGLADIRYVRLFTKEAMNYLEKEAVGDISVTGVTSIAVLVRSRLTVISANIFMKFAKPKVPTKVFVTREQALKWLEQFKISHDIHRNSKPVPRH